ncbi:hypothetical protein FHW84_001815 [Dyella sp. SG562]|uniref:DUF7940 domain-containing protein n=1 Tax=Dyella sp. SG562 TaxID=2587017 RepID=UPI001422551B|nr:hypothetical protein [Dyella sp. SG562]NII73246.1 hypothetical protein [Dyella sp. SG562]
MKLIPQASQWHRLWSIRFAIASSITGAVTTAYAALPADWLPAIPNGVKLALAGATVLTSVSAAVARVVQQQSLQAPAQTVTTPPNQDSKP